MALDQSLHYKDPIEFLNNSRYGEFDSNGDGVELIPDDKGQWVYYSDAVEAVEYAKKLANKPQKLYKIKIVHSPGLTSDIICDNMKDTSDMINSYWSNAKIKPMGIGLYECAFKDGVLQETKKLKQYN